MILLVFFVGRLVSQLEASKGTSSMNIPVVINAAGCGSRLGAGIPKSMVHVFGRTVLEWQLQNIIPKHLEVAIVVGFKGFELARHAKALRSNIHILFNNEWESTKTAASLSLGMRYFGCRCVSLDGDLLVSPKNFSDFSRLERNAVGVADPVSTHPVFAQVVRSSEGDLCSSISFDHRTNFEWTGLVNFDPTGVAAHAGHVFEMIQSILPCLAYKVECVEVDTPQDLKNAEVQWPRYLAEDSLEEGARHAG